MLECICCGAIFTSYEAEHRGLKYIYLPSLNRVIAVCAQCIWQYQHQDGHTFIGKLLNHPRLKENI